MLRRAFPSFLTVAVSLALLAFACAPQKQTDPNDAGDFLPPTDPVVAALGWSKITIIANWAKIDVDTAAHFGTSRNACGKEAGGAIDGKVWNRIATGMNKAVTVPALADTESNCFAIPDNSKMDGTAEAVTERGKRMLFEVRGGQICSSIKDPTIARDMLDAMNSVVLQADKEDCANGWGH